MVATTLVAALEQAVGVDFEVPDGGEAIPLAGFAVVTGVFSVVGIVIAAALLRWTARPAQRFVQTAVTLTAISLLPPLLSEANTATTCRPRRATPRRRDGDDPDPDAEPPHPDRSTIPFRAAAGLVPRGRTSCQPTTIEESARMLNQVADGVWVRQSEWVSSNAIVVRGDDGLILVDPGIDGADLDQLADDVDALGIPVVAGFSTIATGTTCSGTPGSATCRAMPHGRERPGCGRGPGAGAGDGGGERLGRAPRADRAAHPIARRRWTRAATSSTRRTPSATPRSSSRTVASCLPATCSPTC